MPPPNVCLFSGPVVWRLAALLCGRRAGLCTLILMPLVNVFNNCARQAAGKRIQYLRKVNGMTQEELAIKLNISDRHLRRIERGEEAPSIDLFAELKETFRTTLDYLIVGQSPSEEEELLRKKICTKLHRIARSLDAVADDL